LSADGKFFAKPAVKLIAIEIPLTRREILSTEEKRINLDFTQALPQARAAVKTQIAVAVILNIAGALILMLFFTRAIVRRLEVISENSLRLTRREPLLEPLSGMDEISQLDQTLHSVAGKLSEMEILKQQFVAMVGHDLRSPLTSIRLYFDSLESGVYGDISPGLRKMSNVAMRNTVRLIELVSDLLDIEKFESGTFDLDLQSIDLDSILNDTVESMRQVARESRVSINLVESSERLTADPERLTQVFINLLSNAIKYSPVDGKINIFCSNLGKELEISFQDEGRGIAPEYHQIIFDRFKQIEQSDSQRGRGTGLGLAICKAIVEQHHGSIGVVSEVGKGSRFWVKLPIDPPVGIKL
jgi:signal transduction histidine kinase